MNLVVDCSFIMSSVLPDETQFNIEKIYNQIAAGTYTVYVPAIFYLECNNVLISSLKRKRINEEEYNNYLTLLSSLPIRVDKFSSMPESLHTIGNMSRKYDLTSYDACYLDLALRIDGTMATLDKSLAHRCEEANIQLLKLK